MSSYLYCPDRDNGKENGNCSFKFKAFTPTIENQTDKNMENEMETGSI